jgi:chromatin segregation and condensation protein Rec8/ScpA/Scc1 (kleisin family)
VAAAIGEVRARLAAEIQMDFEHLTGGLRRPVEVVAYFLAVLELVRWGLVEATQEHPAMPILLRHRREPGESLVSEWQK